MGSRLTARCDRALDAQIESALNGAGITRKPVLAVLVEAGGDGLRRAHIINKLGVQRERNGQNAVDNRLRELKRDGKVMKGVCTGYPAQRDERMLTALEWIHRSWSLVHH